MTNELTEAVSSVTTALTGSINMATIGIIIASVLGASVGLYVGWFAIRKVISAVKKALKGKLSV